jgi:UDP-3-O-[3-hydroxymyristoyl] glucosamine N-acyltransferase
MKEISIQTIANAIEGTLEGNAALIIKSPEQIEFASEGQITFIGSKKYTHLWQTSNASAVIINDGIAVEVPFNKAVIKVKNADLAMAQVLDLFADALPQFDMVFIQQQWLTQLQLWVKLVKLEPIVLLVKMWCWVIMLLFIQMLPCLIIL